MTKFKLLAGGALLFLLLATAVGGTIVMAQGPTPSPTSPGSGPTTTPSGPRTLADLYWQVLAQKLGLTVDKLQQTVTDARKEAITQGVKQGLLTQAQADRLLQQLQNSGPGTVFDNFGRGRGANSLANVYASIRSAGDDAAAKALGMSTSDLTTALRGGKTLLDLAGEKNVDVSKLRTAIADAEKAALDQAVKDGKITQAQADSLKTNLTPDNIDLNRRGLGFPFGSGGFGPGNLPGRGGFGPGNMPGRGFGRR
jgi:hypothetical protein